MTRLFRDIQNTWRDYRFIHTVISRTAGLAAMVFFCWCFYAIFRKAEPTSVTLALLGVIGFIAVLLTGGQKAAETFAHRDQTGSPASFTTTTTTTKTDDDDEPDPVNPRAPDEAAQ